MKILGIIPARLASTRLPRKVLADIGGKPMVVRTYEQIKLSRRLDNIVVATDDMEVVDVCTQHDVPIVLTPAECPSGTDRCYHVMQMFDMVDACVNIQADEPMMDSACIDILVEALQSNVVVTGRTPITSEDARNSSCVKVVTDRFNRALYFSRWPIPFDRDSEGVAGHFRHVGVYGYQRSVLREFFYYSPGRLERQEKLEQLRFLENGIPVTVLDVPWSSQGVDTQADLDRVRAILAKDGGHGEGRV